MLFKQADGYKYTGNNFWFTHQGNSIGQFNFIKHKISKIIPKINIKPPTVVIAPPSTNIINAVPIVKPKLPPIQPKHAPIK
jgi:hypothetical protein